MRTNPGLPLRWAKLKLALGELIEGYEGSFGLNGEWIPDPKVWNRVRPLVAREAGADRFLADNGITLMLDAYELFLDRVADEF